MADSNPRYIHAVGIDGLDKALEDKGQDSGTRALLRAELPEIRAWRAVNDRPEARPDNLTGLALSGGGIRSATFCLGVIQALVRHDLFKRFDYLSTVSGGGYIGSSITWLTSDTAREGAERDGVNVAFDATRNNFPYGSDDPREPDIADPPHQRAMLQYLRQHGNYLIPGNGITIKSGISVVLRGIIVNFLIWPPIVGAIFFALFWFGQEPPFWFELTARWLADAVGLAGAWTDPTSLMVSAYASKNILPSLGVLFLQRMALFRFAFHLFLAFAVLFILYSAVYSLATWFSPRKDSSRYWLRRLVETWSGRFLWLMAILVAAGTIPCVFLWLQAKVAAAGGIGAAVFGAAAGIWGFLKSSKSNGAKGSGIPLGIIAVVGAVLLLYGVMLISFGLGYRVAEDAFTVTAWWDSGVFRVAFWALLAAVALGIVVNLNYMTIHRYYRDRLMETFMPNIGLALCQRTGAATDADHGHVQTLWRAAPLSATFMATILSGIKSMGWWRDAVETAEPQSRSAPHSPYHILNTNLVLVNSHVRRYRIRGGDNFILSPLFCGSNATGWRTSRDFLGGKLSLATAMAISGAAANPDTGVGGVGLTRNPAVSLLMALLDIRLGYWVRRPRKVRSKRTRPNHFHPGFLEFINKGLRENSQFVQLSDGGHFENLALYELIRRRVRLIVCCDAGADANTSFGDFQVTLRRIRTDFGAQIEFDSNNRPEMLVPRHDAGYPAGAKLADRGHIVGTITYADGSPGTLILLKTTLVPGLRLQVLGYKSANTTFPDQTTADQFFDEEQFEAYRELGYALGTAMVEAEGLSARLDQAER